MPKEIKFRFRSGTYLTSVRIFSSPSANLSLTEPIPLIWQCWLFPMKTSPLLFHWFLESSFDEKSCGTNIQSPRSIPRMDLSLWSLELQLSRMLHVHLLRMMLACFEFYFCTEVSDNLLSNVSSYGNRNTICLCPCSLSILIWIFRMTFYTISVGYIGIQFSIL